MAAHRTKIKKYVWIGLLTMTASLCIFVNFDEHQALCANTTTGEDIFDIKFNNGRLSAKLKNSPLEKVLKEIMSQSGARIWLNDTIDMTVTMEFHNVPIRDGVRKILKGKNYAFVYAPNEIKDGKLAIVSTNKSEQIITKGMKDLPPKPMQPIAQKEKPTFESLAQTALENEDADKREDAIIQLGESRDKRAIEIISKVLSNDPSEDVRLSSINALLEIGDKGIVDPLSIALKDRDPWVRESAVEALGEIGGEAAFEFIKGALNDEDGSVRELAQEILGDVNPKNQE